MSESIIQQILALETQIMEMNQELANLRKKQPDNPEIPNYEFETLNGRVTLKDLFAGKDLLFAIHNMGQGCRWCTLWADGLNGFLPHLEDKYAVALLSKDPPELQQRFAHARGWRYRMASHGGGEYIQEQTVIDGQNNMPGIVVYALEDGKIVKKGSAVFGPGDQFCSLFHILALAGIPENEFIPQYHYWQKPGAELMEDGGEGVL